MVINKLENGCGLITLTPNRSASWAQTKIFIIIAGGMTLAIAMGWTMMGLWVVLPFAGLEVTLLALLMHRVSRSTYRQQVITFEADRVVIESGIHVPRRRWVFARSDAFMTLVNAGHPLGTDTMSLSDTSNKVEIGDFLNQKDKKLLLRALAATGIVIRRGDQATGANLQV